MARLQNRLLSRVKGNMRGITYRQYKGLQIAQGRRNAPLESKASIRANCRNIARTWAFDIVNQTIGTQWFMAAWYQTGISKKYETGVNSMQQYLYKSIWPVTPYWLFDPVREQWVEKRNAYEIAEFKKNRESANELQSTFIFRGVLPRLKKSWKLPKKTGVGSTVMKKAGIALYHGLEGRQHYFEIGIPRMLAEYHVLVMDEAHGIHKGVSQLLIGLWSPTLQGSEYPIFQIFDTREAIRFTSTTIWYRIIGERVPDFWYGKLIEAEWTAGENAYAQIAIARSPVPIEMVTDLTSKPRPKPDTKVNSDGSEPWLPIPDIEHLYPWEVTPDITDSDNWVKVEAFEREFGGLLWAGKDIPPAGEYSAIGYWPYDVIV